VESGFREPSSKKETPSSHGQGGFSTVIDQDSAASFNLLRFRKKEFVQGLCSSFYGFVVDRVEYELAFATCMHQFSLSQNLEMLRGDRLLEVQSIIDLIDINDFVFVNELNNSKP
jgi:hypothetical protein